LIRRNAYFNVARLAAQPTEYLTNFYGDMRDGINSGDDTDRLLVRWELDSPAVDAAAARQSATTDVKQMPGATVALACGADGRPEAGSDGSAGAAGPVLVGVPPDVEGLRRTDPDAAKAWRGALREVLGGLLADGAVVTGFDRSGWYVLEKGQAG
jgi:predicted GNAT superfamily acetyltransferase